ncbi:MAG: DNA cytosine methyltransferase [Gammaproteobacteria bacterium]|nr:DNA cytosine methyltransferase [Gammaproteobacteria bacterium]
MPRTKKANGDLSYASLFSGAGIGCYGFSLENFTCVATVETLEKRLQIQKINKKCPDERSYISGDMLVPGVRAEVDKIIKENTPAGLDVLIATPPCQGMSLCNHKKHGNEIRRNSLVVEAIRAVLNIKPRIFIFENVRLFMKAVCTDLDGVDKPIADAIDENLNKLYQIYSQVLNLGNYGCSSSRTRSLVIGVRKDLEFSPLDILPDWRPQPTLKKVIGRLPSLNTFGRISPDDVFHAFKEYDVRMRAWIKDLKPGQSAFDQKAPHRIPHRIIDGARVYNARKNGDKYRRQLWDAPAPCVHTRNDIMASQNTIHPADDRVFSIRELMLMMSIPKGFKWSAVPLSKINAWSLGERKKFLKKNEMNIRQCIGEAVPTEVFRQIARKIRMQLSRNKMTPGFIRKIVDAYAIKNAENLKAFVQNNPLNMDVESLMTIAENANSRRQETGAYYTPPKTCFQLVKAIPRLGSRKIRVLEPAVGIGRILFYLTKVLNRYEQVEIDVVDIDPVALDLAKIFRKKISIPNHVQINFICHNFLEYSSKEKYDLAIGNPPFGKLLGKDSIKNYRSWSKNKMTSNAFSFFLERAINSSSRVIFITPKSLLNAPEYKDTRRFIRTENRVLSIFDMGEMGFPGVKIETVAISLQTTRRPLTSDLVSITSIPLNMELKQRHGYIFDSQLPCWVIYRNDFFDNVTKKMNVDVFEVFRDRQITKKHANGNRGIRVLKSRNLTKNGVVFTENDVFINDVKHFAVGRFMGKKGLVLIPNLSYNPRACRMPDQCVADGSVAILHPKNKRTTINDRQLAYFSTDEFRSYYRIARNYGTRSLNLDAVSVFFFGVRKNA